MCLEEETSVPNTSPVGNLKHLNHTMNNCSAIKYFFVDGSVVGFIFKLACIHLSAGLKQHLASCYLLKVNMIACKKINVLLIISGPTVVGPM